MSELLMGIYRHYKGPLYQVLGLARDANNAERNCVLYVGLQLDGAQPGPRLIVRDVADFQAFVEAPSGNHYTMRDGSQREGYPRRFRWLGPELSVAMITQAAGDATKEAPQ